jgi:hypothetical protein
VAKEVISRCDVCGTTEGVEEVSITIGGEARTVDLCENDRAPVLKVFEVGQGVKPKKRGGRSAHAVVPIEDLDIEEP